VQEITGKYRAEWFLIPASTNNSFAEGIQKIRQSHNESFQWEILADVTAADFIMLTRMVLLYNIKIGSYRDGEVDIR
jgi:hypothetical protein